VLLIVGRVGEGVDVGGEAGRRRGVYAADMVVDADLLGGRLDGLLDEVDQVGGAELTQRLQRLGAGLDGREQFVLVYPAGVSIGGCGERDMGTGMGMGMGMGVAGTYSGTAGDATMAQLRRRRRRRRRRDGRGAGGSCCGEEGEWAERKRERPR
jgi:hypothetical protein